MGQSRVENILENALGSSNQLEQPQSRIETLLMQLVESDVSSLPKASTQTLGGVKVDGTTITADSDGVISVAIANGDGVSY